MQEMVLPYWASEGFLPASGMFAECSTLSGMAISEVPHRAMVQARQIFVFSDAARRGLYQAGTEHALKALDTLLVRFTDGGDLTRGVAFSVAGSSHAGSLVRDAYAQAFVLLALASVKRVNDGAKIRSAIDGLVKFVDRALIDHEHLGIFDCFPDPSAPKLQNPLMHLLEAYLALHEAWPERDFLQRSKGVVELFMTRLFQPEVGALLEVYGRDWRASADPAYSFFEPGHQFEWAWLLHWYDCLAGTDHGSIAERLWNTACHHGRNERGLCFDTVGLDLRPAKRTHRLWPHAEGAKAAAIRHIQGHEDGKPVLIEMLDALNGTFLQGAFPGGWTDRIDPAGAPLVDIVPASSLYHLYGAYLEVSRVAENTMRPTQLCK